MSASKHDKSGEYPKGCGDCKEKRKERAEPAQAGLLRIRVRCWEGGDADAEREAFEELMERNRSCERCKIGA